jgi:hypothetical protein
VWTTGIIKYRRKINMKNQAQNAPKGDEKEENTTSVNMGNDDLKQIMADLQVKYPAWKPDVEGAMLAGKITDVKNYPFMHQGKGSIMVVIDTGLEVPNDKVAFWLNTVALSQMLKIRNEKIVKGEKPIDMEADFETKASAVEELVDTDIIVQYTGEKKSEDKTKKNLNAYQKYSIVRRPGAAK